MLYSSREIEISEFKNANPYGATSLLKNKNLHTEPDVSGSSTSRIRSLENTEKNSYEEDDPKKQNVNFNSAKVIPVLSLGKNKKPEMLPFLRKMSMKENNMMS